MGIKFGEIDANQIIENEYRIGVLERLLEAVINKSNGLIKIDNQEIEKFRKDTIEQLKNKYPNSGLEYKRG